MVDRLAAIVKKASGCFRVAFSLRTSRPTSSQVVHTHSIHVDRSKVSPRQQTHHHAIFVCVDAPLVICFFNLTGVIFIMKTLTTTKILLAGMLLAGSVSAIGQASGSTGTSDTSGSTGATGSGGMSGMPGATGTGGTSGTTGSAGTSGTTGTTGSTGSSGMSGSTGTTGTMGSSGSGTMGSRGDMGTSSGSSTRTARADRN